MSWIAAIKPEGLRVETAVSPAWPQSIDEFAALIDKLQHRVVQFAFCRLHSLADAEDVVQDVLVQAYRDRERHRHVEHIEAFLFRMVANRSTDLLRKRRHSAGSLDDLAQEPAVDDAPAAGRLRWVEALLVRLPARQAEVIRLRVYADLSFEAVAKSLGCSIPTVKSRFRYGIQKLRRVLESRGGEK